MSRIKGTGTKPEVFLRKMLWAMGLRYRVKSAVIGRPDIVFIRERVAVFVDGCQWHCCPKHWVRPKSNTAFWDLKFQKNRKRDAAVNESLRTQGWRILRFWEHDVKINCSASAKRVFRAVRKCHASTAWG